MVVYANSSDIIHIGRVGENKATTVAFDVTDWIKDFGNEGNFQLLVEKDSEIYPAACFLTSNKKEQYDLTGVNIGNELYRFCINHPEKTDHVAYFSIDKGFFMIQATYSFVDPNTYFMVYTKDGEKIEETFPVTHIFDAELYNLKDTGGTIRRIELIDGQEREVFYKKIMARATSTYKSDTRYLLWQINNEDVKTSGLGKCAIQYYINDILVKSATYNTITTNALGENEGTEPEEYNWVELVLDKANFIEKNIEDSFIASENIQNTLPVMEELFSDVVAKADEVENYKLLIETDKKEVSENLDRSESILNTINSYVESDEGISYNVVMGSLGIRNWLSSDINNL